MIVYKISQGVLVEHHQQFYRLHQPDWDAFINRDNLYEVVQGQINSLSPETKSPDLFTRQLLAPIGSQEVWAAGVTYLRSKVARMEEAKQAGGGNFYDRVYDAERPELFFKATPHRVVRPMGNVRIRRDSAWNVPEPELGLVITSSGNIIGYTIGNDMSSRSIEGENPLYLPQAKTYDGCCALGPGILLTPEPLPRTTRIQLTILRNENAVFTGEITLQNLKRTERELVDFLYRESSFPTGCILLTGTGIVPDTDFTLQSGDEIRITIDGIGTLVNGVE